MRVQILTDTGNNTSQVEIICETGPKTIFELSGEGLPRGQKLLDTLEIYRGDLISQYDVYEEKLHQYFFDRGYAEAKISITIDKNIVYISATRNKRYQLNIPNIAIDGNNFDDNILSSTLIAADPLFREGFF